MDMTRDITAKLTFLMPGSSRPAYVVGALGADSQFLGQAQEVTVSIQNARTLAAPAQLDREGFQFLVHGTRDVDFASDQAIEADYYPQITALMERLTGASLVKIFDHTIRTDDPADPQRRPARHVHNDYTADSARQRTRDILGFEAEAWLESHQHLQLNFWRPLDHPVERSPLAVADARSIRPQDLVKTDIVHPSRTGEIYEVTHNPDHRWYYFPTMTPAEALLIRGYDSDVEKGVSFTPHSAFDDPTSPLTALPRRSIELRAMAFVPRASLRP
ncbi:MAG: CmcJ/NvfI family oxidoreductase [Pseudomonadota bacterium]